MKKLSKRDEQLLLIFIVLAIVLAIYYLMIIPFKDKLEEENLRKETARDEYEELINANNRPEIFQANLDKLIEVAEQKEALIPEKIDKLDMVQNQFDVEKIIPGNKVKCEVAEGKKVNNAYANKLATSFRLTYDELEQLINRIVSYEQKTGVDNINFTIDNNTLVGTMDIYFYSKVASKE